MTRTISVRLLFASVVIALLAACAPPASPAPHTTSPAAVDPTPELSATVEVDMMVDPADAPDRLQFTSHTLDGAEFDGASLYGVATVVWFWAPWCPICQADAPAIADAIDEMPEGVQIIGIPGKSDEDSMRAFVERYGLEDMVQVVDVDGSLWTNFSVASQPAITLISSDGTIHTVPGSIGKAGLLAAAGSIS